MLNQIILVGRLVENPQNTTIKIAVPRSFKNSEGVYDTDFFDCEISKTMVDNVTNYCYKGDIIGVRGRLSRLSNEKLKIVAERVTFLSSRKSEQQDDTNNLSEGEI